MSATTLETHNAVATQLSNTFADRAAIGIKYGIPVIPCVVRSKETHFGAKLATLDQSQIGVWNSLNPHFNTGFVAQATPSGVWILDCDSPTVLSQIQADTGHEFPSSFRVRSASAGHVYFRQNQESLDRLKNFSAPSPDGKESFSVRWNNQYCVGPLSVHPSGAIYTVSADTAPIECPGFIIDWLLEQDRKFNSSSKLPSESRDDFFIGEGKRDNFITSQLGKIRQATGVGYEVLLVAGRDINERRCRPELPDKDIERIARSISTYSVRTDTLAEDMDIRAQAQKIAFSDRFEIEVESEQPLKTTSLEMSASALGSSRLQDIYMELFQPNGWPLEFALPALVTAASVLVPRFIAPENQIIHGDDNLVNLYTGFIGPVHCGKSQVTEWGAKALGIWKEDSGPHYFDVNAGSAEQLIDSLDKRKNQFINSVLVIQDEWSYFFTKATVPNASFGSFLTKSFYRKHQVFARPKGKEVIINHALSFAGGIVEEDFDSVFNASTLGGCYDRFLFGYVPRDWKWSYRPYPLPVMDKPAPTLGEFDWKPVPVSLDNSVFEVVGSWNKKDPNLGRIVEICTRIATIYASMDGRIVVTGKDLESLWGLAQYQLDVRKQFQPNAGQNPDAQFANAALTWVQKYARDWVSIRDLKQGVHSWEMKLGPNVAERALYALARSGQIQLWVNTKDLSKNPPPPDYKGVRVPSTGLVRAGA